MSTKRRTARLGLVPFSTLLFSVLMVSGSLCRIVAQTSLTTAGPPRLVPEAGATFTESPDGIELSAGPGRLVTDRVFEDVVVRFEYRALEPRSEAILFLRAWFTFGLPDLERGYRVHLGTNASGRQGLGRVTTVMNNLRQPTVSPPGASAADGWHRVEVRLTREVMSVSVNGLVTTAAQAVGDAYGFIGLRTTTGSIRFRQIEVEEVSPADRARAKGISLPHDPGLEDPRVLREVQPVYTADAMRSKVQGVVVLEVVVLPDGKVGDVQLVKRLHPGLDQKAVEAARQWRFSPATRDGKPMAVYVTLQLSFRIF